MKGLLKEFETFAIRGNAVDLAIGVVLGAAFGTITTVLTNNVITPVIGIYLGGIHFEKLGVNLPNGGVLAYGLLIQALINFVLIAFVLFLFVKLLNSLAKKRKDEEQKPEENAELAVLMEIRDALGSGANPAGHDTIR